MWSRVVTEAAMKKAMWVYPMVSGFTPSERWGHSACYSSGHLYVFGGCCGGLHFSDILVLDLELMTWRTLPTTGQGPGPRDSHSAVIVGETMIVFGGTNGLTKVNELHILDLRTKEWSKPDPRGLPPSPRESHTATLIGDDRIVVFGGSGEGEGNYLNDLHVLDIRAMQWSSPEVNGEVPVPRDSHSAVAMGKKLVVYGGDCGDRYYGDIDVLDMDTMTWSKLDIQGFIPGVRAGHGTVSIGKKVYVIGGVGHKHYYSDVWVLDFEARSWSRVDIHGQPPQGRFSHTAVVIRNDIFIYGGCGEDERPLNELLLLQLGKENPIGHRNISGFKVFGRHWNQVTAVEQKLTNEARRNGVMPSHHVCSNSLHLKRRRTASSNLWEIELEQEEHSLSISQNSSPSQSDQDQPKVTDSASQGLHLLHRSRTNEPPNNWKDFRNFVRRKPEPQHHVHAPEPGPIHNLIGADVRGKVDGAFDSGYLITATVNGRIFRGILFAPAPINLPREPVLAQNPNPPPQVPVSHPLPNPTHVGPRKRSSEPTLGAGNWTRPFRVAPPHNEANPRSDLQGVVLTLGGPGTSHVS